MASFPRGVDLVAGPGHGVVGPRDPVRLQAPELAQDPGTRGAGLGPPAPRQRRRVLRDRLRVLAILVAPLVHPPVDTASGPAPNPRGGASRGRPPGRARRSAAG